MEKSYFGKFIKRAVIGVAVVTFAIFGTYQLLSGSKLNESLKGQFTDIYIKVMRKLYPALKQPVAGALRNDFPLMKLALSRKDIAHFEELYRQYEGKGGQEYYNQNNKWRRAKLFYNGESYRVKIKAHGSSPDRLHRAGKFISFGIKILGKKQIHNTSRFSLLVHERLIPISLLTDDMASRFGLINQKRNEVILEINNWEPKLYFFEYRLNSKFMEANGKSSLKIFSHDISESITDKSLVFADRTKYDHVFDAPTFRDSIRSQGIGGNNAEEILNRYLALNNAIAAEDYLGIESFFDRDYITSFNAVRLLLGYLGHGSVLGNLYVFFDMANGKFYPALTRDHYPGLLPENRLIENRINNYMEVNNYTLINNYVTYPRDDIIPLSLFQTLSQNDRLRQITYKKVYDFIRAEEKTLPKVHRRLVTDIEKMYYLGWLKETLRALGLARHKNVTEINFSILKQYLEESKPRATINADGKSLNLSITAGSMAALKLSRLSLNLPELAGKSIKVFRKNWVSQGSGISSTAVSQYNLTADQRGNLDLSASLLNLRFSDGLDAESIPQKRTHHIVIEARAPGIDWAANLEKARIEFQNTITGQIIKQEDITLSMSENLGKKRKIPEAFFAKGTQNQSEKWQEWFPEAIRHGSQITIPKGRYLLPETVFFPENTKLILSRGVRILMAPDTGMLIRGSIEARGAKGQPVLIGSADPRNPFGAVAVLGTGKEESVINYMKLSDGSEKWMDGAYYSAAFSLHYQKRVSIQNSHFSNGRADDGVNIKYSLVALENNTFKNNFADQIDLDYCVGSVKNSLFFNDKKGNNNGDGLDISGSQIYASGNLFNNFGDKGISVGEQSKIFVFNNAFEKNNIGCAVKDLSKAYFLSNQFGENEVDIKAYQKKKIFGGGEAFIMPNRRSAIKSSLDKKSRFRYFSKDMEKASSRAVSSPMDVPGFFDQLATARFQ